MAPRVLVSDKLSPTAVQIFKDRGVEVDYLPDLGKDKEKLLEVIGQYDGLAIRSATKVTEKVIAAATLDLNTDDAPVGSPVHEEFYLYHTESVEASGFCIHFKLPHYVTFQSILDAMRDAKVKRAAAEAAGEVYLGEPEEEPVL